jgi:hypothetical protein
LLRHDFIDEGLTQGERQHEHAGVVALGTIPAHAGPDRGFDHGADDTLETDGLGAALHRVQCGEAAFVERRDDCPDRLFDELILGAEVVADRRDIRARVIGDVAHRHFREAILREQHNCAVENTALRTVFCALAYGSARRRAGHCHRSSHRMCLTCLSINDCLKQLYKTNA